jgi:transcriptional regulator with XRE-family HTH domain
MFRGDAMEQASVPVGTLPAAVAGFVCLYYGNTGSSWLLSALDGSPAIHVPGFEPIEDWAWDVSAEERLRWLETVLSPPEERGGDEYARWLAAVRESPQVTEDPTDHGFSLTGLKMNDLAIVEADAVIDIIDRTGSKVIHLARNNRLKHALSMHRYHDEDKSQFHGKDRYAPTHIRFGRFNDWIRESERLHRLGVQLGEQCEARLGVDRVFHLAYEDFTDAEGKQQTLNRLADFLGIPADFGEGEYAKATPDSLPDAIANYPTFRLRYRLTRHAKHLD